MAFRYTRLKKIGVNEYLRILDQDHIRLPGLIYLLYLIQKLYSSNN